MLIITTWVAVIYFLHNYVLINQSQHLQQLMCDLNMMRKCEHLLTLANNEEYKSYKFI